MRPLSFLVLLGVLTAVLSAGCHTTPPTTTGQVDVTTTGDALIGAKQDVEKAGAVVHRLTTLSGIDRAVVGDLGQIDAYLNDADTHLDTGIKSNTDTGEQLATLAKMNVDLQTKVEYWSACWFGGKTHKLAKWIIGIGAGVLVLLGLLEYFTAGAATGVLSSVLGVVGGMVKMILTGLWVVLGFVGRGFKWVWGVIEGWFGHPDLNLVAATTTPPPATSGAVLTPAPASASPTAKPGGT